MSMNVSSRDDAWCESIMDNLSNGCTNTHDRRLLLSSAYRTLHDWKAKTSIDLHYLDLSTKQMPRHQKTTYASAFQ